MSENLFYREWRVAWSLSEKGPVLYSVWMPFFWEHASATADQLPETEWDDNHKLGQLHGLHALDHDTAKRSHFLTQPKSDGPKLLAQGAVTGSRPEHASGRIVYHDDGVVRCEHMRIFALRVTRIRGSILCEHADRLAASSEAKRLSEDHVGLGDCVCRQQLESVYVSAYLTGAAPAPPHLLDQVQIFATATVEELEDLLCQRYEVPHLPLGIGPWDPPWGEGLRTV